ncbi:MAG: bifunctional folylpolyglutamate synthase/dihydrofolate synthase [Candidatus Omnitrophica bacterium]|nr:bifunctional folylpolyglutamate synthase/dihydrofolate synthase [Candidatus Omnitrophota bacterium]
MTYSSALKYLDSLINYERWTQAHPKRLFELSRIRRLLNRLGNPEKKFASVLIAGTKGKGSTAAMLESILRNSGYRTGLYTSPHLSDLRERIQINGKIISKKNFVRGVEKIRGVVNGFPQSNAPTYFEALTALAFLECARAGVEITVAEVGMGGRLDAANVLSPRVSVITSISYDHMKELGPTLAEIAGEKAGIIKRGGVIVTAPQELEVMNVIRREAERKKAVLLEINSNFKFLLRRRLRSGQRNLNVNLRGDFQQENAAVAVRAAETLAHFGFKKISAHGIQKGLAGVRWPGRFEVIPGRPTIVLDGAHNGESMEALARNLRHYFGAKKILPILAMTAGKDLPRMIAPLRSMSDRIIVTEYAGSRAWQAGELTKELSGNFKRVLMASPPTKALELARILCRPEDVLVVTGSLYLVGAIKEFYESSTSAE